MNAVVSQAPSQRAITKADIELINDVGEFFDDPLGFVLYTLPWGQPGTRLAKQSGPDTWQVDVLTVLGERVRAGESLVDALPTLIAVASGHGIGKTALIAWIILWFISTREHPQIVVTAGKKDQLTGKTWRELHKWLKMSLVGHWFHWTATKLEHILFPESWFAHAIPWSKNAPENFAGTHEEHVLVIMDEASAIDDSIWEVTDGAMTTPGAIWIAFGNPTRTSGRFFQCFGKLKHRWFTLHVDSRTAKMANRALLDQWVEDYGEDSDFVRVRVRGLFPRAGSLEFIGLELVAKCFNFVAKGYEAAAKVMSVDVARHGDDQTVISMRQGNKVWPLVRLRIADLMQVASRVAALYKEFDPDALFIDATGMGWGVVDRLNQLNIPAIGVQTGEAADDDNTFHLRTPELWYRMREWMQQGAELPRDPELEAELTQREYGFDGRMRIQLESKKDMKKRDLASPDGADAIAVGFYAPVAPRQYSHGKRGGTWKERLKRQNGRRGRGGKSSMAA